MVTFKHHFKILRLVAVAVQILTLELNALASTLPDQPKFADRPATIAFAATSPPPNWLSEDTYTPPDNGGPSSTQGSGTR